jgi:hypothetical protein
MMTQLLDRVPRYASLMGLSGLIGLGGIFDPEWCRFSAFSFLSFLCFFRFFRCFVDPYFGPTATTAPVLVWAIVMGTAGLVLTSNSPVFGLAGFAGYFGLYHPARRQDDPA